MANPQSENRLLTIPRRLCVVLDNSTEGGSVQHYYSTPDKKTVIYAVIIFAKMAYKNGISYCYVWW